MTITHEQDNHQYSVGLGDNLQKYSWQTLVYYVKKSADRDTRPFFFQEKTADRL